MGNSCSLIRGSACLRSDREDHAYADLNKVVELGTKMWVVNEATGEVRLSSYPDSYLVHHFVSSADLGKLSQDGIGLDVPL